MPEQPGTGRRSHRGRRAPVLAVKTTTRLCRPALTSLDNGAARQPRPVGWLTPPHRQGGPTCSCPALTGTDDDAVQPSWNIEDCVLRPGRTSPPNYCARAVTFCRRTQSSIERYVLDLGRHSPQGHPARAGASRPKRGHCLTVGGILRGRVRVAPGEGIRRRRGQDSCPRARGMPPVGGKCPRPREAPPPKDKAPEPHAPCPSRPHRHRAGPHTCWDPARRHGDKARRLKRQPRPVPQCPSCRRRCAPAP